MFKAIISAALMFSPLAFAHDEPVTPAPTDAKEAPHGKHKGGAHHGKHGEKPAAPEAPAR